MRKNEYTESFMNKNQLMNKFLMILLVVFLPLTAMGQKKDISQARTYIKSGKNLDKAEQLMWNLLKDSVNRDNVKIRLTLFDAIKKQYEIGNEKLYLKQQYDTTMLFKSVSRMFSVLESLDSLDERMSLSKHSKLKYREKYSEYLNTYRPNLYNGGRFFVNKHDYTTAYSFFDLYIDCLQQPLFKDFKYEASDQYLPSAAYWSMYCGYKLHDYKLTLKHSQLALRDSVHLNFVYQYFAETYKAQNDTVRYLQMLNRGFDRYPKFPFFFPRLIDYYCDVNSLDSAMNIVNRALHQDSTNVIYLFAKSTVLLNKGDYDGCITICDSLITKNDSLAEAYYNLGLAYFNQAIELDKVAQHTRSKLRYIRDLYAKSRPYIEKYRLLAPDQKEKWLPVLYTIYLNLNMGKQFDELEKMKNK